MARRSGISSGVVSASHRRERLIASMTVVAGERGWQNVTVDLVCDHAKISKRSYYEVFRDREDCFLAAVDAALGHLLAPMLPAAASAGPRWASQVGAAISTVVASLDADRTRAWLVVVEASNGSDQARQARAAAFEPLAQLVDDEGDDLPATGNAAVGALLELVYRHLNGPYADEPMLPLLSPIAYLVFAPRLGQTTALREAHALVVAAQTAPAPTAAAEPESLALRIPGLTEATLLFLADHPGAQNLEIAAAVGVDHESQISRHLHRLAETNVASKIRSGRSNAWELTPMGHRLARQLQLNQGAA
jgi:AcrR family transcriptional regulator